MSPGLEDRPKGPPRTGEGSRSLEDDDLGAGLVGRLWGREGPAEPVASRDRTWSSERDFWMELVEGLHGSFGSLNYKLDILS